MSEDNSAEDIGPRHIAKRLAADHPKRILALDGGGTRGIVSLVFLAEIERVLGERFAKMGYYRDASEFRLAHYYDMIGGTSVGSMIAVQLAWGDRVSDIERRFKISARKIFTRNVAGRFGNWVAGKLSDQAQRAFGSLFDARTLRGAVWGVVGNEPLGSDKLHTGLTVISKRVDSGSVWALNNNPGGRYYAANKDHPLPDLVRASTAAPTFFSPKSIRIYNAKSATFDGLFVDGGISPHNNPALKLLLMAGVSGYNFGGAREGAEDYPKAWPLGADNLLITSVGTGSFDHIVTNIDNAVDAATAVQGMVNDGQELAMTLLQWLSSPRRAWTVDRMYGDMSGDNLGEVFGQPDGLISFHRYDVKLDKKWLEDELEVAVTDAHLEELRDFTSVSAIDPLRDITAKAAHQVDDQDFPAIFDGNLWQDGELLKQQKFNKVADISNVEPPIQTDEESAHAS